MDLPVWGKILFVDTMKKQFSLFIIVFFAMFSLHSMGLFDKSEPEAAEVEEKEPLPAIQDLYTALDPALPVIGFLEPDMEANIPYEAGLRLWDDFLEDLVKTGVYKPAGFGRWFAEEYSRDLPRDIIEILYDVKKQKLPLDYLGNMKISRDSDKFLVQIGIHDLKTGDIRYFYRIIDNLEESWDFIFPDLMNEFYFRMEKEAVPLLDKKIYIEPLKVRYFQYYELQSGEYAFTEIPFLTLDDVDFRGDNGILSDLIGMKLHLSGIFPVLFSDFDSKVKDEFRRRPGCSWGIRGELRIADRLSVFRMEVYDYKRQDVAARYDFPFHGYDTASLYALVDLVMPFLLEEILSESEKQRICFVTPDIEESADRVYTDKGYLGPADFMKTYILQAGLNNLLFIKDTAFPIYPENGDKLLKENPDWEPEIVRTLVLPDLSAFNISLLADPSGEHYRIYKEKDILYAETLFQE